MIDLDAVARRAGRLEPLPASALRLARLVCDGAPDLTEVVDVVRCDQALTAAVLRAANSSWSASRTEVTTVHDAVVRLGAGPVLATVLAVDLRARLDVAVPELGLSEGDLWRHSVAALVAAEHLARCAGGRLPGATATAALLHDVGKLLMARFVDRALLGGVAGARDAGVPPVDAEREVLGVDHAELGALVAHSWGLPAPLVHGIGRHHDPDGDHGGIAAAVALADHAAHAAHAAPGAGAGGGPVGTAEVPAAVRHALAVTGLDGDALAGACVRAAAGSGPAAGRFA